MIKKCIFALVASVSCIVGSGTIASELSIEDPSDKFPDTYVKDRYFVGFEYPNSAEERIVDLPNFDLKEKVPFGQHSSGQSGQEIAERIGLKGEVLSIYDTLNTIYISATREEALRLEKDPRVLYVEQDIIASGQATQYSPGWGLDRLDESGPGTPDSTYNYSYTGAGQTIYVLDSGLSVSLSGVIAEFGSRASVVYDYMGLSGNDCHGHGSSVASVAAGATHGVAKGATVVIAKITIDTVDGCTKSSYISTSVDALNWLATNEDPGTIINWSNGLSDPLGVCSPVYSVALENAFGATYAADMLNVVAAGNDGCNTADYSPTALADTFVVGATSAPTTTYDPKWYFSRTGTNIATFAPGENVAVMDMYGSGTSKNGTSFSAPYVAGIMAVVCEASGTDCATLSTATKYASFKSSGSTGTVTEIGGGTLIGATSRFIWQQW
ncbi:MAG: S8 family serine peptidase [Gammaproteobacteria bacterium]